MNTHIEQVKRFYDEIWNQKAISVVAQVLDEAVTFRGSLGQETSGHTGFIDYLNSVHQALSNYRCIIEDLVADDHRVFARMTFTGVHTGMLLNHAPTGNTVSWAGTALFSFAENRIRDIWVLGDLRSLENQLTS